MKPIAYLICRLVIAMVILTGCAGIATAPAEILRERQLHAVQLNPASVNMAECSSASELKPDTIVAVCRSPGAGNATGELHLLIIDRSAEQDKVLYQGPSVGDSFYIRPTVLSGEGGSAVILAEAGAEFSYGIGVYVVEPGRKIHYAGEIELGAPGEDGPTSAVPYLQVERKKKGFCFRFTHDLVRQKPDGTYATVSKDKAFYMYKNGRIVFSKSCN
jgi:hypothetical protein